MGKRYNRAFVGYSPKEVENRDKLLEDEFKKTNSEISIKLEELLKENQKLQDKVINKKYDMSKSKSFKEELESSIIKKHMEAAREIYETEIRFEEMIRQKAEIINKQQIKNQEIKESINKLLKKVKLIVETEE
jgi:hypothetical protein